MTYSKSSLSSSDDDDGGGDDTDDSDDIDDIDDEHYSCLWSDLISCHSELLFQAVPATWKDPINCSWLNETQMSNYRQKL